jgi:hypothetical protein
MNAAPKIFGKPRDQLLGDIGYALQQVKRSRGLSSDDMRIVFGLKDDDMVSKYIAGDNAMSVVSWLRALEAWPELIELLQETDTERALKGRQRPLDLDPPRREAA